MNRSRNSVASTTDSMATVVSGSNRGEGGRSARRSRNGPAKSSRAKARADNRGYTRSSLQVIRRFLHQSKSMGCSPSVGKAPRAGWTPNRGLPSLRSSASD